MPFGTVAHTITYDEEPFDRCEWLRISTGLGIFLAESRWISQFMAQEPILHKLLKANRISEMIHNSL